MGKARGPHPDQLSATATMCRCLQTGRYHTPKGSSNQQGKVSGKPTSWKLNWMNSDTINYDL